MKKATILLMAFVMIFGATFAQDNQMTQRIPLDPAVRTGKLENGMTYYIQHNSKPKNSANFHIVTNIGAVHETDRENGLAHFLEHMAFNGIGIFPHETMLEYLQNNGIEFGRNINASTGLDVTQYFLQDIPLNKSQGLVDTAMLILRDWSCNILCDSTEIDAERGVISEELRQGSTGQRKLLFNRFADLGNGTMYSKRNVIGTLDWLRDFEYSDIRGFYKKWYRPSLQAVIIVGDFDVDEMEAKVKELYGAIKPHDNEVEKVMVEIPQFEKSFAKVYEDKELTSTDIWVASAINESKIETNDLMTSEVRRYMFSILNSVLNNRFQKIAMSAEAPFLYAENMNQNILATQELRLTVAGAKEGKEKEAIEIMAQEINRMKKYGVNGSELRMAVNNLKKSNETAFNNRNDRTNTTLAFGMISNFTENMPIIQPEMDYQFAMGFLSRINKEMVNQYISLLFKDVPYYLSVGTPKANITEQEVMDSWTKGITADVQPIIEKEIDTNILDEKTLTAGRVLSTAIDRYDTNMWILSNGAIVYFKPTELKKDEMIFSASRKGGKSLFNDDEFISAILLNEYITSGMNGVGKYSDTDLQDALSGKQAKVSISLGDYYSNMGGRSSSADVETMFKLINLNLSQPRFNEEELATLKMMSLSTLKNYKNNPNMVFQNFVAKTLEDNQNRVNNYDVMLANIDKANVEDLKVAFKKGFTGVRGMKFFFVGNAPVEKMKQYAELYIGSLPAGEEEKWINRESKKTRNIDESIVVKQEDDKASVLITVGNKVSNDLKTYLTNSILGDILQIKYTEIVREKMGATYGVGSIYMQDYTPAGVQGLFVAQYKTNDGKIKESTPVIIGQIEEMAAKGPAHEDFIKSVLNRKKNYTNNQIHNSYWMGVIKNYYTRGYDNHQVFEKTIDSITEKDVQNAAKQILKNAEIQKIMMTSNEIK